MPHQRKSNQTGVKKSQLILYSDSKVNSTTHLELKSWEKSTIPYSLIQLIPNLFGDNRVLIPPNFFIPFQPNRPSRNYETTSAQRNF